jgi:hypothetical protein
MSAICVRLLLPCCGRRDYGAVAHLFPARSQSQKRQAKSLRATITSPSIYTGIAIAGKLCNR